MTTDKRTDADTDMTADRSTRVLTVNEAAHLVGVSPRTVRRWIAAGLPATETRAGRLVDHDALLAFADAQPGRPSIPRTDTATADVRVRGHVRTGVRDDDRVWRLLEEANAERRQLAERLEATAADLGYWRGQAEAWKSQALAIAATIESEPVDVVEETAATPTPQNRQDGPGRTETPETAANTLHPRSWLGDVLARWRGR